MKRNLKKTSYLSRGDFSKYDSKFTNKKVFRVGCVKDEFSFFHAFLTATDKSYRNSSKIEKIEKMISKQQKQIYSDVTLENWNSINNSKYTTSILIENINNVKQIIDEFINNPNENHTWIYNCFTKDRKQLLLFKKLNEKFELFNKDNKVNCVNFDINKFKTNFCKIHLNILIKAIEKEYNNLSEKYEDVVIENTIDNYKIFLQEFLNIANQKSYEKIIEKTPLIDNKYINFISDIYKTNIIIVSDKLGFPYKNNNIKKRDTIFLLKVDNHFECLGFKKNEDTLKCKFEYNNKNFNLIKKILKTSVNMEIEYNNENTEDNESVEDNESDDNKSVESLESEDENGSSDSDSSDSDGSDSDGSESDSSETIVNEDSDDEFK